MLSWTVGRAVKGLLVLVVLATLFGSLAGCVVEKEVIMATTTSTRDSGLLDVLIPAFEAKTKFVIKSVAVGSGAAIEMGVKGEADVLLTHAPASERPLLENGTVTTRRLVMHNDFILVGPAADPAKVKDTTGIVAAFQAVAASGGMFVSRGDDSGTHKMELALWAKGAVTPKGAKWYQEAALSMGETLGVASEKQGYCLTDRATYLARKDTLDLVIVSEGDPALLNLYHVMEVSRKKFSTVNEKGAKAWADWLLGAEAQALIAKFGVDKYGAPLFFPDAGKTEAIYAPK